MNNIELRFLEALKASLRKEQVNWEEQMPVSDWLLLFRMAEIHHVLPLIYEAVFRCPAARALEKGFLAPFQEKTKRYVYTQMMKTNEFYLLSNYLAEAGQQPLVVKGLMCRNLYPEPDYRLSSDEDLLIPEEDFAKYHELFLAYGLEVAEPEKDIGNAHEVPYVKPGRHLYIELHKQLFPPDSEAYGDLNHFFEKVHEHAVLEVNNGLPVRSLGYTDHMFYLICHAFKHFLHSGFGIRQVCDIVMFAEHYKEKIDWSAIYRQCKAISAEYFTVALFAIGDNYLGFPRASLGLSKEWDEIDIDETELLKDLLSSGVYGASDGSRLHSSNITLNALIADKKGEADHMAVVKTIFPTAKKLRSRYPYLKRYPVLLPFAWIDRLYRYRKETTSSVNNKADKSIRIGNQRVELLKKYRIMNHQFYVEKKG